MTSSVLNAVNFACAILFVIAQILYIDHIRIICRRELKDVALGELRPLLRQISDLRRFTEMASDDKLEFGPLPAESLDWVPWFESNIQKAQKAVLRVKNDKKLTETISYLSIYLMGYRWDRDTEMWPPDVADISKLTANEIIDNAPSLLDQEKRFLQEDESLYILPIFVCIGKCKLTCRPLYERPFPRIMFCTTTSRLITSCIKCFTTLM